MSLAANPKIIAFRFDTANRALKILFAVYADFYEYFFCFVFVRDFQYFPGAAYLQ